NSSARNGLVDQVAGLGLLTTGGHVSLVAQQVHHGQDVGEPGAEVVGSEEPVRDAGLGDLRLGAGDAPIDGGFPDQELSDLLGCQPRPARPRGPASPVAALPAQQLKAAATGDESQALGRSGMPSIGQWVRPGMRIRSVAPDTSAKKSRAFTASRTTRHGMTRRQVSGNGLGFPVVISFGGGYAIM